MPRNKQSKQLLEYTGEMHRETSDFITAENEVKLLVNADTEKLGVISKRKGNTKLGDTLTSSTSTTTSTTSTSTSTTTS